MDGDKKMRIDGRDELRRQRQHQARLRLVRRVRLPDGWWQWAWCCSIMRRVRVAQAVFSTVS